MAAKMTTEKIETTMKSETTETKTVILSTQSLIDDETTYERTTEVVEDIETQNQETTKQSFR